MLSDVWMRVGVVAAAIAGAVFSLLAVAVTPLPLCYCSSSIRNTSIVAPVDVTADCVAAAIALRDGRCVGASSRRISSAVSPSSE